MSFCLFSPLPTDSAMHSSVAVLLLLSSNQFSATRAVHEADSLPVYRLDRNMELELSLS